MSWRNTWWSKSENLAVEIIERLQLMLFTELGYNDGSGWLKESWHNINGEEELREQRGQRIEMCILNPH